MVKYCGLIFKTLRLTENHIFGHFPCKPDGIMSVHVTSMPVVCKVGASIPSVYAGFYTVY
jgi:hypothetical protein